MRVFLVAESIRIGVSRTARQLDVPAVRTARLTGPATRARLRSSRCVSSAARVRTGSDRSSACRRARSTASSDATEHSGCRICSPKPPRSFDRFDDAAPGELVALENKSLGRLDRGGGRHPGKDRPSCPFVGWTQLHVAIDHASRVAVTQLRPSCGNADTIAFLEHALQSLGALGIRVQRVLTDNRSGYKRTFHERAEVLGVRHTRTKPYHPWTNGRVERLNGTIQRECLYAQALRSEEEREVALALRRLLQRRTPNLGLGGLPPLEWLRRNGTYVRGIPHVAPRGRSWAPRC